MAAKNKLRASVLALSVDRISPRQKHKRAAPLPKAGSQAAAVEWFADYRVAPVERPQ